MKALCFICVICVICGLSCSRSKGPFAYVTNEKDGTITVIDTSTDRVYSTIKVGGRLRGIRLSPDKQKIWVAISYPSNQSQGEDKIAELDRDGYVLASTKPAPIPRTSPSTTTPRASTSPTKTRAPPRSPTSKRIA